MAVLTFENGPLQGQARHIAQELPACWREPKRISPEEHHALMRAPITVRIPQLKYRLIDQAKGLYRYLGEF